MSRIVHVADTFQQYTYECVCPPGEDFDIQFNPHLTPRQMLDVGVFGGKYMTDCQDEFPSSWFTNAKLSPHGKDPTLNFFGVNASLPLKVWQQKGRIHPQDPRGRFQRYCRYYMGRRTPQEDQRQIKRRKAFKRHRGAVRKYCKPLDFTCRRKQRQALLHWGYDSRKI